MVLIVDEFEAARQTRKSQFYSNFLLRSCSPNRIFLQLYGILPYFWKSWRDFKFSQLEKGECLTTRSFLINIDEVYYGCCYASYVVHCAVRYVEVCIAIITLYFYTTFESRHRFLIYIRLKSWFRPKSRYGEKYIFGDSNFRTVIDIISSSCWEWIKVDPN